MSADSAILREYLVSLGFRIDQPGQKKFDTGLGKLDLSAKGLTKSLIGVATATQAMVGVFAYQMEKLYYSAKKAESTASSLQAIGYGASTVGIGADQMKSSIEGMARAMRSNPGLQGLLNSLGVKTEGRSKADVWLDFVTQLKTMPFAVAERYANMFGTDADTLFLAEEGLEKMKEGIALRKKAGEDMGIDADKAAEAGKEYANQWREIMMYVELFKDSLAMALLPGMQTFAQVTKEVLTDWIQIIQHWKGAPDFLKRMREGITGEHGGGVKLSKDALRRIAAGELNGVGDDMKIPGAGETSGMRPNLTGGGNSKQSQMAALEKKYGLPSGLLDSMWQQESGRGKNMLSPAGAEGDFQFMPKTAKEFGVDTSSFSSSAEGAAKKMAGLIKYYQGDLMSAVTAYSAGEGVLNQALTGKRQLSPESAAYGPAVLNRMEQTNHITINGAGDPGKTATAVASAIKEANSDLTRNNLPKVK